MAYQTLLSNQRSTQGSPYCYYTVEVEPGTRTSTTLAVNIRVTAHLAASDSYLGTGNTLTGKLTLGSTTISFTIHGYSDSWSGTSNHVITASGTVTGLSQSTTSLSAKFAVDSTCSYGDPSSGLSSTTCSSLSISSYTPPTPTVNTITVSSIPIYVAGYPGDSFSLTTKPSGGSGYTYKWLRDGSQVSTSQTYNGTLTSSMDNTDVLCVVTDSTSGQATTNNCEFRVGLASSQTAIMTHQIEPVKIYNGTKFVDNIPYIKTSDSLMYCNWTIQRTNTNVADIAIAGNAVVG